MGVRTGRTDGGGCGRLRKHVCEMGTRSDRPLPSGTLGSTVKESVGTNQELKTPQMHEYRGPVLVTFLCPPRRCQTVLRVSDFISSPNDRELAPTISLIFQVSTPGFIEVNTLPPGIHSWVKEPGSGLVRSDCRAQPFGVQWSNTTYSTKQKDSFSFPLLFTKTGNEILKSKH